MLYYRLTITNRQASQGENGMAGYLGFDATDTKPYIFISYNTEDQVRLSKIAKALRDHQVNIWYDNGIHRISDEEWQEQIAIHIREAEIVFFFLTQGIFEKKNSFVKKEAGQDRS